jgi:hypothetical protein
MYSSKKLYAALAASVISVSGCYVVPVGPDGHLYAYPPGAVPYAYPPGVPPGAAVMPGGPAGPMPTALNARLYPANEIATQTGVITGTVTNMMTGKGRFQLNYRGEVLTGEATRVNGDARRGVASAYGAGGSFMSCEYQMHTPQQGAGTCTFSNGGKYQVHIGG